MTRPDYYVFAFESTHAALAAARLLSEIDAAVMPTLRAITAGCGISLRVSGENLARARALLAASSIEAAQYALYRVEHEGNQARCTRLN